MANDINVDVRQWLRVREAVAEKLQTSGSRQQIDTRRTVAEKLLESGYIDVAAVLRDVDPAEGPKYEGVDAPEEGDGHV